jgi:hypothetical protein
MNAPALLGVEWSQGIEDAWSDVATFVPKLVAFLAILFIGWLVAKALARAARGLLERIGFNAAIERGGIKKALEGSQYDASELTGKLIFYGLMLLVLQMAFGVFGDNPVSDLIHGVIAYLPRVLAAIVIIVVAAAIASVAKEMIGNALGGLGYGEMLGTIASIAIVTVGVFAALSQLEIAPAIINSLFYAILAVIAGSAIVAIGGGGIQPMRQRWQNALDRYDEEKPRFRQQMQASKEQRAAQAAAGTPMVAGQGSADMARSPEHEQAPHQYG